jgi:hypothetical protein
MPPMVWFASEFVSEIGDFFTPSLSAWKDFGGRSNSWKGRFSRPVCLAARTRSSAARAGAVQAYELDRGAGQVGDGGEEAVPVVVAKGQLGAGVRTFATHDHARARRPRTEHRGACELGHPGALPGLAVLAAGRPPRRLGQAEDRVAYAFGEIEPITKRIPASCRSSEGVRGVGRVGAHQDLGVQANSG